MITPKEVGSLELEWSVGNGDANAMYSGAVAGDQVLVTRKLGEPTGEHQMSGTQGEVSAYPVDCPDPCRPTWAASTERPILRMTVADDVAYVAERATGERGALLYAFDVDCGSGGGACDPLWTGRIGAGVKWNTLPLVTGGRVIVASSDAVFAFEVGCGMGGARCEPVWLAHPGGARAEPGSAIMASTTGDDAVYVASPEVIAAYPVDCEDECAPLWSQPAPQIAQWLALWDETLVVGSMETGRDPEVAGGNHVWALRADCPSIKSMIGHTMGAASPLEAIASVMAIRTGVIPPTINLEHADPACDLDYVPGTARTAHVRVVLSNSMAFGGSNACAVFAEAGDDVAAAAPPRTTRGTHRAGS